MLGVGQLVTDWKEADELSRHLEIGDLVEFRRVAMIGGAKRRVYTHWALYLGIMEGDARVVHISTEDGDFEGAESLGDGEEMRSKLNDSFGGFKKIMKGSSAEVRTDSLSVVAGNDMIRINNGLDATHRPFPPSIILDRATHKLGEGNYNLVTNNCEHFVKWCRYGNKISSQAIVAKSAMLASVLAVGVHPLVAATVGLTFALSATPLSKWINRTIGNNLSLF